MPARNPAISIHSREVLADIGGTLRARRRALGVSAVTTAEAAGMSRVTLHRIEAGSPSVTIGALMSVAAALGLQLALDEMSTKESRSARTSPTDLIRVGDFDQLRAIAWQLHPDTELTGVEALHLYERNWRHFDQAAMDDDERALIQQLADAHSAGVLLV